MCSRHHHIQNISKIALVHYNWPCVIVKVQKVEENKIKTRWLYCTEHTAEACSSSQWWLIVCQNCTCQIVLIRSNIQRAQWLRGRALDSRLREPRFESCAAVLKSWASFFTLHCSSSLSCINEYLAIDSGGYVHKQSSCINCNIWLDVSQRSRDGVWVNRSVRGVKCKALWTVLHYIKTCLILLHKLQEQTEYCACIFGIYFYVSQLDVLQKHINIFLQMQNIH